MIDEKTDFPVHTLQHSSILLAGSPVQWAASNFLSTSLENLALQLFQTSANRSLSICLHADPTSDSKYGEVTWKSHDKAALADSDGNLLVYRNYLRACSA